MNYTQDRYYNSILEGASDLKLLCDDLQAARDEAIGERDKLQVEVDDLKNEIETNHYRDYVVPPDF